MIYDLKNIFYITDEPYTPIMFQSHKPKHTADSNLGSMMNNKSKANKQ